MEISTKSSVKVLMYFFVYNIQISPSMPLITPLVQLREGEQAVQPISWKCVRRVEAVTSWQFVQSRGYPKLLNVQKSRCSWKIVTNRGYRIRLAFRGLDLYADDINHCSSNYIEIIDESLRTSQARFCGSEIPNDIVSEGPIVRIDFQAQPGIATNSKGFSIGFSKTLDTAGFYSWQSFSPQQRSPQKPSTYVSRFPNLIRSADSSEMRLPNDASQNDEDGNTSIGSVVGGLIGAMAIMLLGLLIWKNRNDLKGMVKKGDQEKETNSTSFGSYPLPSQSDADLFERIMSVVEPYPAPCEDDRSIEVASTLNNDKNLPLEELSEINNDASLFSFRGRDFSRPTSRLSQHSHLPRQISRLNSFIGNENQSIRNQGRGKMSIVSDVLMEPNTFSSSSRQSSIFPEGQNDQAFWRTSSLQSKSAPKFYLPQAPLLPIRDENEPPPLPPKNKSRVVQDEFNRPFRQLRTTSRCSLPFDAAVRSPPRRSKSYGSERLLDSQWYPRSKSVSNLTEMNTSMPFTRNFSRQSRHANEFERQIHRRSFKLHHNDNADSFSRHNQKEAGGPAFGCISDSNRHSKCEAFSEPPNATPRQRSKWTALDPPDLVENHNFTNTNESSVQIGNNNVRSNGSHQQKGLCRTASRSTIRTVSESLPPPLPIKKKPLNRRVCVSNIA